MNQVNVGRVFQGGLPADYLRLLRAGRVSWLRLALAPAALVVAVGVCFVLFMLAVIAVITLGGGDGNAWLDASLTRDDSFASPGDTAFTNLLLALGVPAVLLATRWAYRVRSGAVHSVTGRFRVGWWLDAVMWPLAVWAVVLVVDAALSGEATQPLSRQAALIAGVSVLTTPLQAAGEEYVFRGWLLQGLGRLLPAGRWGVALPIGVSAGLFTAVHGSTHPLVLTTLFASGVLYGVLTWRTGGLEAAVAVHTAANLAAVASGLIWGDPSQAEVTDDLMLTWPQLLTSLVIDLACAGLVLWRARRRGLQWRADPATFSAR